jgi:ectoine hydroxylase-related dioxygenase (phytanoyl-CoA dioxygenase family)
MSFADGSHEDGFIRIDNEISDLSEAYFEGYVRGKGFPITAGGAMAAGDATFHSGWTLHRAPGNVTETVREVMTIIYLPADAQVTEPTNAFQKADLATWLNGAAPGSLAEGPLNPVLWP